MGYAIVQWGWEVESGGYSWRDPLLQSLCYQVRGSAGLWRYVAKVLGYHAIVVRQMQ